MFQGPVASYVQHRVLSGAALNSGSGSQRVGQICNVRLFLDLEPCSEMGWDEVQDVRTGPGWEHGGATELTVSFASGIETGVGRCLLGADATCWNK